MTATDFDTLTLNALHGYYQFNQTAYVAHWETRAGTTVDHFYDTAKAYFDRSRVEIPVPPVRPAAS